MFERIQALQICRKYYRKWTEVLYRVVGRMSVGADSKVRTSSTRSAKAGRTPGGFEKNWTRLRFFVQIGGPNH